MGAQQPLSGRPQALSYRGIEFEGASEGIIGWGGLMAPPSYAGATLHNVDSTQARRPFLCRRSA
jgi:hypothetical protein